MPTFSKHSYLEAERGSYHDIKWLPEKIGRASKFQLLKELTTNSKQVFLL